MKKILLLSILALSIALTGCAKKVAALYYHDGSVYVITDEYELYAWGKNDKGQLGVGDTKDRLEPTEVKVR